VEASSVSHRITNKSKHQFKLYFCWNRFQKRNSMLRHRLVFVKLSDGLQRLLRSCSISSSFTNLTQKVTRLILPVFIRLFKRLSHACLSINIFIQWNCVQLIISVIISLMMSFYTDNCRNSRANTCVKLRLSGRSVFIRYKINAGFTWSIGDS
jgi:hypothetical protein